MIDEAVRAYIDWRDQSEVVWDAYDHWASRAHPDNALAFGAYRAALEREEHACRVYATLITEAPIRLRIDTQARRTPKPASRELRA
jgi:hypothetical protein